MPDAQPRQGSIAETPLVQSEREGLRNFAAQLHGPDWAIGILIDSALWHIEQTEKALEDYAEHANWRCGHPDRWPWNPDCPCGLVSTLTALGFDAPTQEVTHDA